MTVALLSGSHKLHLVFHALLAELHLCSAKVLKHRQMRFLANHAFQLLSHFDAAAYHYYIYVVRGALQEYVPNKSSHHITFQPQMVCSLAYLVEYFLI